jgi:hypothetical protein
MNPTLKILLIRDGSLLDEDNLALIARMAEEAGGQIWIEMVGDGKDVQVLIEDGMVKRTRRHRDVENVTGPAGEEVRV